MLPALNIIIPKEKYNSISHVFDAIDIKQIPDGSSNEDWVESSLEYRGRRFSMSVCTIETDGTHQATVWYISKECEKEIKDFTNAVLSVFEENKERVFVDPSLKGEASFVKYAYIITRTARWLVVLLALYGAYSLLGGVNG